MLAKPLLFEQNSAAPVLCRRRCSDCANQAVVPPHSVAEAMKAQLAQHKAHRFGIDTGLPTARGMPPQPQTARSHSSAREMPAGAASSKDSAREPPVTLPPEVTGGPANLPGGRAGGIVKVQVVIE